MNNIRIKKAYANNLKHLTLEIPHNKFVVITGVSGSGKSSLAFNTIFQEGQRYFLESLSTKSRQILNKLQSPKVEGIEGMWPAIALNQNTSQPGQRSTLGTLTGIYDLLRLLFARCGKSDTVPKEELKRSLFSFNTPLGACPLCNGLGIIDKVDPYLLIKDENLTIREGAFEMTTPTGYIVYSQVTQNVLNDICQAHDFTIDIPWKDLTEEEKDVILYGSNRIKIPFGKHTLESRLKWSGITAKPREEGFYKGIIPVMEEILKRDRNDNVLRFTRNRVCPQCKGYRLNDKALDVTFAGKNISYYTNLTLIDLNNKFLHIEDTDPVFISIRKQALLLLENLIVLGLGYLTLDSKGDRLTMGELQRARLAALPSLGLQNMVFVFDEPSAGLHMQNISQLISILKEIRDSGNSVIIVEHDLQMIRAADWLIDLGPEAGEKGGEILYNGPINHFLANPLPASKTQHYLNSSFSPRKNTSTKKGVDISFQGIREGNLKNIDIILKANSLNVITGLSGSGSRIIIEKILIPHFLKLKENKRALPGKVNTISGLENYRKLIWVDQKPIGRTSRSNPATYTKVFDRIRSLFAGLDSAKKLNLKAGDFSFNNKSGSCEKCQGNGVIQIGMHFMEDAYIVCDQCNGKRYKDKILSIKYRDKNIAEILDLSVKEALEFFADNDKIANLLEHLVDLGIGYLKLGQSSTTLSGGEAQRVKLASELSGKQGINNLYILNDPSGGLHPADNNLLISALRKIAAKGNLIVVTDQDPQIILAADNLIELGTGCDDNSKEIIFSGHPENLWESDKSLLKTLIYKDDKIISVEAKEVIQTDSIELVDAKTHNLKGFDLTIAHNKITTFTGISGSGKSSLLYDTIFSESNRRFTSSLSAYARSYLEQSQEPEIAEITGLTPAVAISQKQPVANPRSTVGTFTGIYNNLRLLYSRIAQLTSKHFSASQFSFNHQDGACPACKGLGIQRLCDADLLLVDPTKSLLGGALIKHKTVDFYLDSKLQYLAILEQVAKEYQEDLSLPWEQLSKDFREIVMYGSGDRTYNVIWDFKRGKREGSHSWNTTWPGLTNLINEEYQRKHTDHRGKDILPLLLDKTCTTCNGSRLISSVLEITFVEMNIAEICNLELSDLHTLFSNKGELNESSEILKIFRTIEPAITKKLKSILDTNLGYLSLDRMISTLSTGEIQRLRIANQIDAAISGITYIFDEPTRSLHHHNRMLLWKQLQKLRDQNNTILIIEHDPMIIKESDVIVELGPGAGNNGGQLIFQGSPQKMINKDFTVTAKYLKQQDLPILRKNPDQTDSFSIAGVTVNNLHNLKAEFYHKKINVVTGVSGSGKTSLIFESLFPTLLQNKPINCKTINLNSKFNDIVAVNNRDIRSNAISSVATYSGIMTHLRKIFAELESAKNDNIKGAMFSYTNKKFQCPSCKGRGINSVSMDFMSDIVTTCPHCKGKRYDNSVNKYRYKDYSISDLMNLTLLQLTEIFSDHKKLMKLITLFNQLGLDYLTLGQSSSTLSGGEKQRLLLIKYLLDSSKNNTLFLIDEPSKGLHPEDCKHLLQLIKHLKKKNNTIIMIEHNIQLISAADHIIDIGPGAGKKGGKIIAKGSIKDIMNSSASLTGEALNIFYK